MTASFELTTPLPHPAAEVYEWHSRPGAFLRLAPPWQGVRLISGHPVLADGAQVELKLRKGPFWVGWTAEHQQVRPGRSFQDVQRKGPFRRWVHTHDFQPLAEGGSLLRDHIDYCLPGGTLGSRIGGPSIRRDLERTFTYRHAVTAGDLDLHAHHRECPRQVVAITGASGLIGRNLGALLASGGHRVVALSRGPNSEGPAWDPSRGLLEPDALPDLDAVVHLAGENIAGGRWTEARKRRIRNSRVQGTRALVDSLERLESRPGTLICASAVGIFGDRGDERLSESSLPGEGFLARVGVQWEEAALAAERLGIRVVLLRFGVVLTPAGGFLKRVLPPFRWGLGGRVADGTQKLSWISIDDAIGAIVHVLSEPSLRGPVHVTAPQPVDNHEMTAALGRALGRPTLVPLPAFAARAAFGGMADELLLASVDARPDALEGSGYRFRHPRLADALAHILGLERRHG